MPTPPILILKAGTATKKDIALMRKHGVAVLEVVDPKDVRYMDPPLATVNGIEALCFKLVDELSQSKYGSDAINRDEVRKRIAMHVMADCRGKQPQAVAP